MKTVRRLLHGEIITAVTFVAIGFLALFMFFDLVDELQSVARHAAQGYQLQQALLYITLKIPEHLYQLLPLSVLIGCIFVMARLAQSSEFTILRTGGLDPLRALSTLLQLGVIFVGLTFLIGDYIAPWADRQAIQVKAIYQGHLTIGQTGAWLKEKQQDRHFAVNVRSFDGIEHMRQIRIHEFNEAGQLLAITTAAQADIQNGQWALQEVEQKTIGENKSTHTLKYHAEKSAEALWPTEISADMVAAALLTPDRMRTWELFKYMRHLSSNNQNSQRYEIEFWRKVFYPLSCLVMLVLALPFAYLHFRSGQIAGHVFVGVLAGISFSLLNNVFRFVGDLQNWEPWLTSAAPSLIYSAISLAAFWWMVLRR
ncbi:MAG: LPS export ABC transporter permease LptG [Limnohabitans sp.]